jgi:uncharacterized membrane protein YdcZ (DUF606 family)
VRWDFLLRFFVAGVVMGGSIFLASLFSYFVVRSGLNRVFGVSPESNLAELLVSVLGTILVGLYLIGYVLVVVQFTNAYPQWSQHKWWFWVGGLAGIGLSRLLKR